MQGQPDDQYEDMITPRDDHMQNMERVEEANEEDLGGHEGDQLMEEEQLPVDGTEGQPGDEPGTEQIQAQ